MLARGIKERPQYRLIAENGLHGSSMA